MNRPLRLASTLIYHVGGVAQLLAGCGRALPKAHRAVGETVGQIVRIGYDSLILVGTTATFIGMVAAVQTTYQIKGYVPELFIGMGVSKAVMIELGPVLTALVIAGRVGAGIAAELGSLRVTEQIDALEVMAVDPYRFLILPRLIAGIIAIPALTIISEFISIAAAIAISRVVFNLSTVSFITGMRDYFAPLDLWGGILKSVFFGFIIVLMGCYYGYNAKRGAAGVGRATTEAVVASSLLILITDYIVGVTLFSK